MITLKGLMEQKEIINGDGIFIGNEYDVYINTEPKYNSWKLDWDGIPK